MGDMIAWLPTIAVIIITFRTRNNHKKWKGLKNKVAKLSGIRYAEGGEKQPFHFILSFLVIFHWEGFPFSIGRGKATPPCILHPIIIFIKQVHEKCNDRKGWGLDGDCTTKLAKITPRNRQPPPHLVNQIFGPKRLAVAYICQYAVHRVCGSHIETRVRFGANTRARDKSAVMRKWEQTVTKAKTG